MMPKNGALCLCIQIIYQYLFLFCIGTVTDGEFNSLRTQGSTRPLHLWQLIHDAKESVSHQREQVLKAMLVKIGGWLTERMPLLLSNHQ